MKGAIGAGTRCDSCLQRNKRANELEKRRVAEEKETEKLDALAEKQRKLKEKEADKLRNDASKAAVKAKRGGEEEDRRGAAKEEGRGKGSS